MSKAKTLALAFSALTSLAALAATPANAAINACCQSTPDGGKLVTLALPAQAASTTKSAPPVQLAQRPYDPSAGSVGFKKSKKKKKKK